MVGLPVQMDAGVCRRLTHESFRFREASHIWPISEIELAKIVSFEMGR